MTTRWRRLVPLGAVLAVLAGCGQPTHPILPSATPPPGATTAAAPSSAPEPTLTAEPTPTASGPTGLIEPTPVGTMVEVTLADGKAEPNGKKVELARGDTVVFVITSDRDDELHVHGVDLEIPVKAGETVTRAVTVDRVGRFDVESHNPELLIAQLVVR